MLINSACVQSSSLTCLREKRSELIKKTTRKCLHALLFRKHIICYTAHFLQHLNSPSVWMLCFCACLFKAPTEKPSPDWSALTGLNGYLPLTPPTVCPRELCQHFSKHQWPCWGRGCVDVTSKHYVSCDSWCEDRVTEYGLRTFLYELSVWTLSHYSYST